MAETKTLWEQAVDWAELLRLDKLAKSAQDVAKTALDRAKAGAEGLLESAPDMVPGAVKTVNDAVRDLPVLSENVKNTILEHYPNLDQKGQEAIGSILEKLESKNPAEVIKAFDEIQGFLDESLTTTKDLSKDLKPALENFNQNVSDMIKPTLEEMRARMDQVRPTQASPVNRPVNSGEWFLKAEDLDWEVYKQRSGNAVKFMSDTQDVFQTMAQMMIQAKKSINLITMGFESDMRLVRHRGEPYEYNRRLCYDGLQGHHPNHRPYSKEELRNLMFDPKHPEHKFRMCSILQDKAESGVKVRLLVWSPGWLPSPFYDPANLWLRSKLGIIPNMEFAFCDYQGKVSLLKEKPQRPELVVKADDDQYYQYRKGVPELIEQKIERLMSNETIYNLVYSHHQKLVLTDIEESEAALGMVLGANVQEEYWDDRELAAYNALRHPYRPWRDCGYLVRGPVLVDIANNFEDRWNRLQKTSSYFSWEGWKARPKDTISDWGLKKTNESYPVYLVARGLADLSQFESEIAAKSPQEGQTAYNQVKGAFNVERFKNIVYGCPDFKSFELADWNYELAPHYLEKAFFFASIAEMTDGALKGHFRVWDNMRPAKGWNHSKAFFDSSYDAAKYDPGHDMFGLKQEPRQEAQFLRTFTQEGIPNDISILYNYVRSMSAVQNEGLLYFENQYFRDPYIAELICALQTGGRQTKGGTNEAPRKPHVIIITNRLSNGEGEFMMAENIPAEEPTYIALKMLKEAGVKVHCCWLHVREKAPKAPSGGPINYEGARRVSSSEILMDIFGFLFDTGMHGQLEALREKSVKIATVILEKIYPMFEDLGLQRHPQDNALYAVTKLEGAIGAAYKAAGIAPYVGGAAYYPLHELDKIYKDIYVVYGVPIEKAVNTVKAIDQEIKELINLVDPFADVKLLFADFQNQVKQDAFDEVFLIYHDQIDKVVDSVSVKLDQLYMDGVKQRATDLYWNNTYDNVRTNLTSLPMGVAQERNIKRLYEGKTPPADKNYQTSPVYDSLQKLRRPKPTSRRKDQEKPDPLPGRIYVHSKVLVVDTAYGLVGSANINERSMWHDTESALGVRGSEKNSVPEKMREDLLAIILKGTKPEKKNSENEATYVKKIFEIFGVELGVNDGSFDETRAKLIKDLDSHVMTLDPRPRMFGSSPFS